MRAGILIAVLVVAIVLFAAILAVVGDMIMAVVKSYRLADEDEEEEEDA